MSHVFVHPIYAFAEPWVRKTDERMGRVRKTDELMGGVRKTDERMGRSCNADDWMEEARLEASGYSCCVHE